jgi:hypothetical protein
MFSKFASTDVNVVVVEDALTLVSALGQFDNDTEVTIPVIGPNSTEKLGYILCLHGLLSLTRLQM